MKREEKTCCSLKGIVCPREEEISEMPTKEVFISFDSRIDEVILRVIIEAVKNRNYEPVSFKDVKGVDFWCAKICPIIRQCAFMIVDVSFWSPGVGAALPKNFTNPNVAMEIGMGIALRKNVIFVLKEGQTLGSLYMSNLLGVNFCIFGRDSEKFRKELEDYIDEITRLMMKQQVLSMALAGLIEDDIDLHELHSRIEEMADTRLVVKNRFSIVTYPDDLIALRAEYIAMQNNWRKTKKNRYEKALRSRVNAFRESLKLGGEHIDIYQVRDIEHYAKIGNGLISGCKVNSTSENKYLRKRHLENILELLRNSPNYKIYLTELNVGFTFTIAGPILVLPSRDLQGEGQARAVITTVPSLVKEFSNQFFEIANSDKTKTDQDEVKRQIEQIKNLIK